ncbi:hypothetical protein PVAP13_6NG071200 [Panicum virgatum]|uniref:Uncharacterized protein n=1 Tax=Panicum virgatum TaxID=38727 RepID=A0A8T0QV17_PANVG|nr:hypothetical protein PVAP13_6NG071200 [Panicum virgatum]
MFTIKMYKLMNTSSRLVSPNRRVHTTLWKGFSGKQSRVAEITASKISSPGLFDHLLVNDDLETCYEKSDDADFFRKLAKGESVMVLPGIQNWLRITFATDPAKLKQGKG